MATTTTRKKYTPQDLKKIREQIARGVSYRKIAASVERTEKAISVLASRMQWSPDALKLSCRRYTDKEDELIIDLRAKGYDNAAVADAMGRSSSAISSRLNNLGLVFFR